MTVYRNASPSVSRDFIVLFVVIMIFIAVISLWVAHSTFKTYSESTISAMEREALRIDRTLIVEIKSASYILESLARQIVQIGTDNEDEIAELLRSFDKKNKEIVSDEFLWIDTNQDIVMSSSVGVLNKVSDASDRDYVKKSFTAPWEVHIGRPIKGKVSDIWILPVSLGVTDYKGNFIGIIVFSMNISRLTEELRNIVKDSNMSFSIYTKTFSVIASADAQNPAVEADFDPRFVKAMQEKDVEAEPQGILSKPTLFSPNTAFSYYDTSSQFPYIVHLTYNPVLQNDGIFNILKGRLIQIFIIAIFLLSLLWMVRTRVIKPVEKLSKITSDIAAGRAFQPLPSGGPVEIERLSHQIKKLSDYITEQHRTERELNLKNHFLTKLKETTQLLTKVRSDFLHIIAKELQTPIEQALKKLELLATMEGGKYNNEHVHEASISLHYLQQMVEDVKLVAELEYGNITMRESSVNLSFTIHRALRQFHEYPQFKHIDVKLKIADNLPVLLIDEDRFSQIIKNILCGAGATLAQGNSILITVQPDYDDNGQYELGIQFKYLSQPHSQDIFLDKKPASGAQQMRPMGRIPLVKSESINFALARMLVSLFGGKLQTQMTKNDVNRIYVSFPKERLIK